MTPNHSHVCVCMFQSQLEVLQYECELTEELKKETKQLREKLSTMEGYVCSEN